MFLKNIIIACATRAALNALLCACATSCAGIGHTLATMASESGLNALVQQAKQLTADITEASGELPHVHRNLYQIHEAGQRLLERTSGVQDGKADVKA